jgi:putative transposase
VAADVRRVSAIIPAASIRHICRVLEVSRSSLYPSSTLQHGAPAGHQSELDDPIVLRIQQLIQLHPTYGYRRIWALLRFGDGLLINRKRVYRLMRQKRWLVRQRQVTPKPRVQRSRSRTQRRNERWAMDVTHIACGRDGWAHLTAVIDCYDREIVGYEFALRGRANEAERALEAACLYRFGTLRPLGKTPVVRSDNGLIFQSRQFRAACRFYRLDQEYITPYTPEQNGLIERFFRSLKEECVWQHTFTNFTEAKIIITNWIQWYNEERPHQALGCQSPKQYHLQHQQPQQQVLVA